MLVGPGDLGGEHDLGIALRPDRHFGSRAGGFVRAPLTAEQVEFPCGVESGLEGGEVLARQPNRRSASRLAAAAETGEPGRQRVLAQLGVAGLGGGIDRRPSPRAHNAFLRARLLHPRGGLAHVEVPGLRTGDEIVESRVVERGPPLAEVGARRGCRACTGEGRRDRQGRRLITRTDGAAAEHEERDERTGSPQGHTR